MVDSPKKKTIRFDSVRESIQFYLIHCQLCQKQIKSRDAQILACWKFFFTVPHFYAVPLPQCNK